MTFCKISFFMQFFVGQKAKAPEVKNKAKGKIVCALQRESSKGENVTVGKNSPKKCISFHLGIFCNWKTHKNVGSF